MLLARQLRSVLTVLLVLLASASLWCAAVASADDGVCPAQVAALEANHQKILEHNSRAQPGGVGPPEIVIPYNREADQLDAERASIKASLQACKVVIAKIRDDGPAPKALPPNTLSALGTATAAARPQWTTARAPVKTADNRVTIPSGHPLRPVWDVVKKQATPMRDYPDVPLQGTARPSVGFRHPSGYTVGTNARGGPAVSADHIVPKVELLYLPRFLELTPENMWEVLNAPLNLQWLPSQVNSMNKNSKSAADMQGVDPEWQQEQIELQDRKRRELTDLIAQLADSQLPKP